MIKECPICKSEFHVKPSSFKRRLYCSKQCLGIGYKNRMVGRSNPNYKSRERVQRICVICNTSFFDVKNLYGTPKKTCSSECYGVLISKVHSGKILSKEARGKISAANRKPLNEKFKCSCGNNKSSKAKQCQSCFIKSVSVFGFCKNCNTYYRKRSHIVSTCSRKCFLELKTKQSTSGNNPNWKGGIKPEHQRIRNHVSYKEWRNKVFKRDEYTCQDCGQVGNTLHAHHIKAFSKHPDLRLNVSNGKTLCLKCHKKHHPFINVPVKDTITND